MLTLLLITMLSTPHAKAAVRSEVIAQRKFSENCSYVVVETSSQAQLSQKIEIVCAHRQIFAYDLGGVSSFSNIVVTSQGDRIILNWERGMTAGTTVVKVLDQNSPSAQVVFEESSRSGVEVFEDGNVLLAHVGRLVRSGHEEIIVPKATNVYIWKNGEYRFSAGYTWNRDYDFANRYCILLKHEGCPAVRSDTPIPDDGS